MAAADGIAVAGLPVHEDRRNQNGEKASRPSGREERNDAR